MKKELFVVAAAIIKDKKVYSAQRGSKGKTAFKWEFPGGKIESGETPQEALVRELKEELSIEVSVHEIITSIIDEYEDVILHIDTYRCSLEKGTPILSEHIAQQWSDKNELVKLNFSPADKPTIEKIIREYL